MSRTVPIQLQGRSRLFHSGQAKLSIHLWLVYSVQRPEPGACIETECCVCRQAKNHTKLLRITFISHVGEFFLLSSGTSFTELYYKNIYTHVWIKLYQTLVDYVHPLKQIHWPHKPMINYLSSPYVHVATSNGSSLSCVIVDRKYDLTRRNALTVRSLLALFAGITRISLIAVYTNDTVQYRWLHRQMRRHQVFNWGAKFSRGQTYY